MANLIIHSLKELLMRFGMFLLGLLTAVQAQAAVVGEDIRYQIDGQDYVGYLARDDAAAGPRPAVIVVHEWWGHNAYARQRANMLAAEGYVALALDMYGGGKHTVDPSQAQAMMQMTVGEEGAIAKRFEAARRLLADHPATIGDRMAAIGYCFGGGVVLNMARAGSPLKGVVSFHGSLASNVAIDPAISHPKVLIFNGEADPFVKPEQVKMLKDDMDVANMSLEYVGYPGVLHSFTNPGADVIGQKYGLPLKYDAAADRDSWERALSFLSQTLWSD